jgi:hypothetical protein
LNGARHRPLVGRCFVSTRSGCPPADGYHMPILAPGTGQAKDPGACYFGVLPPIQFCGSSRRGCDPGP